jgi:hypothetical protein
LQNGKWKRKKILPKKWVKEASSAQIIQHPELPKEKKDLNDWEQGYGYQMWRSRKQCIPRRWCTWSVLYCLCLTRMQLSLLLLKTPDMQDELNAVWKFLLPANEEEKAAT